MNDIPRVAVVFYFAIAAFTVISVCAATYMFLIVAEVISKTCGNSV